MKRSYSSTHSFQMRSWLDMAMFGSEDLGGFLNLITELQDDLQRLGGRRTIVLLFAFGELIVGDQAGVFLVRVIARRAEGPALGHSLCGPDIVGVFGQAF